MDLRSAGGFLGTGASLASDLSLVAYVFLIVPGMLAGFLFARRKMFVPHHKAVMTTIVIVNWLIIGYLMVFSYSRGVAPGIPERLGEPFFLSPTIHLLLGFAAQILGTVLVIRMWFEYQLPKALRFEPIKTPMRLTLALWLVTALLGVLTYLVWYGVPFSGRDVPAQTAPAATPEATEPAAGPGPEATGEVGTPEATEPAAVSEPEATGEAIEPEETEPAATPEATPGS